MKKLITAVLLIICMISIGALAHAAERERVIEFAWHDPSTGGLYGPGVAGFRLYMGTAPDVEAIPGNLLVEIPYTYVGIIEGEHGADYTLPVPAGSPQTYYFVVTAFSDGGLESDKSNEVSIDLYYPSAPHILRISIKPQ